MNAGQSTEEIDGVEDALASLSSEEVCNLLCRTLLRRFWHGASYYWKAERRHQAWGLTIALLIIILLGLATSYAMNVWNRAIFDALQNHDGASVLWLALLYVLLLIA